MPRFKFSVDREVSSMSKIYDIEADTQEQAEELAFQEACDDDWDETGSDYIIKLLDESIATEPVKPSSCCPFCRSTNIQEDQKPVFVEYGEYDDAEGKYEEEGNSVRYICQDCKQGFIVW